MELRNINHALIIHCRFAHSALGPANEWKAVAAVVSVVAVGDTCIRGERERDRESAYNCMTADDHSQLMCVTKCHLINLSGATSTSQRIGREALKSL